MIMEIISILLGVILVNMAGGGKMSFLIDLPSLIIILVFTVPLLCRGDLERLRKRVEASEKELYLPPE